MADTLIQAEGVGKRYVIGHQSQRESYMALRDVLVRKARTFFRKASDLAHGRAVIEGDELEEVWALRDVSFEVKRGEVLGIIGRNGAGKSTLLKILSRITEPTTGRVLLRGRVASLLEVGTGFHLELTGRENIFLNGAILGMSRAEIRRRFDEIVAFAEVEKFLDTPVKRYSSGMYVRLAFAVAAHLEPEILIVDEVLAVGDLAFQKKCLGKMRDVSASDGRSVLFVSHNLSSIRQLCDSAILLERGELRLAGTVSRVIDAYSRGSLAGEDLRLPPPPEELIEIAYVTAFALENSRGERVTELALAETWLARVTCRVSRPMVDFVVGLGVVGMDGTPIQTAWSSPRSVESGNYEVVFEQNVVVLEAGSYYLNVGLSDQGKSLQHVQVARLDIGDEPVSGYFPMVSGAGYILNSMIVTVSRQLDG